MPVVDLSAGLASLRLPTAPGTYSKALLASVVQRCPLLEHLAVALPRYHGGAPEIRLYRLLGELARLRRLELHLDASPLDPEARLLAPEHKQLPRRHVDDNDNDLDNPNTKTGPLADISKRAVIKALIDSAVDEKLALAIFGAVSLGKEILLKPRRRDSDSAATIAVYPLEALSFHGVGGEGFADDGAGQHCEHGSYTEFHRRVEHVHNYPDSWRGAAIGGVRRGRRKSKAAKAKAAAHAAL
ncbi:hypothetical protein N658DRAFT_71748 [Parathielavia hyrcaniae]|uniref:Uncharacterized protein n=1 Tax=Parathielavia hyrcaniae TaxID=113614 RepID=A0AAN6Q0Q2_9PEZI|nr:hypothetical protein N658DRAFT_71748 [Parathielavia hyrcaniae]